MPALRRDIARVLVPCDSPPDERVLESCRARGLRTAALFSTRLHDLDRPGSAEDSAYVKRIDAKSVVSAAAIFGVEAVLTPCRDTLLEISCRDAGLTYLEPTFLKAV